MKGGLIRGWGLFTKSEGRVYVIAFPFSYSTFDFTSQIHKFVSFCIPNHIKPNIQAYLGTAQNLLYYMAGGEEKLLQKICSPRMKSLKKI